MKIQSGIFILVLVFSFHLSSFSDNVSLENARMVAGNFFFERIQDQKHDIIFGKNYAVRENGTDIYYVFNVNKGFIIVSATDAVFPILGYSLTTNYTGDDFPDNFKFLMNQYTDQILIAIHKKQEATKTVKQAWKKYTDDAFVPDLDMQSVEPLIQTTWSQGCYYNSQFPADTTAP